MRAVLRKEKWPILVVNNSIAHAMYEKTGGRKSIYTGTPIKFHLILHLLDPFLLYLTTLFTRHAKGLEYTWVNMRSVAKGAIFKIPWTIPQWGRQSFKVTPIHQHTHTLVLKDTQTVIFMIFYFQLQRVWGTSSVLHWKFSNWNRMHLKWGHCDQMISATGIHMPV